MLGCGGRAANMSRMRSRQRLARQARELSPPTPSSPAPHRPRTRLASQACEPCRRRKVRCDAERPECGNCRALELECEYSTQRRKRGPKPRTSSAAEAGVDTNEEQASTITSPPSILQPPRPSLSAAPAPITARPLQADASSPALAARTERPAEKVHQALTSALMAISQSPEDTIKECIDMSISSPFPSVPVIQTDTLRQNSSLLLPASRHLFEAVPNTDETTSSQSALMRAFAHSTAAFALICCRMRQKLGPARGEALITAFLAATRGMMACCEDWDVSHANSTSLVIRTCQSAVLHHLGKTRASWLMMGEAIRLAMDMRLYDESSYQNLDPLESKLRRNMFGLLCISDMSASILNNRPLSFHEICLDETYTPVELYNDFRLLPAEGRLFEPPYEQQLHQGIYLCHGLWKSATNILLDMKLLSHTLSSSGFQLSTRDPGQQRIMQSYMSFCGILDSLPPWLRNPERHIAGDEAATAFQQRTFWYQRADLVVTFHCLRLFLLQRASQKGLCALLGLTDDLNMLALRKIDIASDLASVVGGIPFEALQANGEPLVEKLRQVGVSLLEIAQQNENTAISGRAQSLLSTLIDTIARLDSRVSDELSAHPGLA